MDFLAGSPAGPNKAPKLKNNFIPSTALYAVIPKTRLPGAPLVRPEATQRQIVGKHREISLSKVPGQQNRKNFKKSTSLKASPMGPMWPNSAPLGRLRGRKAL